MSNSHDIRIRLTDDECKTLEDCFDFRMGHLSVLLSHSQLNPADTMILSSAHSKVCRLRDKIFPPTTPEKPNV